VQRWWRRRVQGPGKCRPVLLAVAPPPRGRRQLPPPRGHCNHGAERPRQAPRVTVARDGPPRRPHGAGHARGAGFRLRWGPTYSVPAFWGDVVRSSLDCDHEAEVMAWRSSAGCWAGPGGSSGPQRGGCQPPVNSLLCGWPRTTLGRAAEEARWRTCGPPVPHGAPCIVRTVVILSGRKSRSGVIYGTAPEQPNFRHKHCSGARIWSRASLQSRSGSRDCYHNHG